MASVAISAGLIFAGVNVASASEELSIDQVSYVENTVSDYVSTEMIQETNQNELNEINEDSLLIEDDNSEISQEELNHDSVVENEEQSIEIVEEIGEVDTAFYNEYVQADAFNDEQNELPETTNEVTEHALDDQITTVSKESELTSAETEREASLEELTDKILTSDDPKEYIYSQLKEIYSEEDAAGIMQYIQLNNATDSQSLMEAISAAGVQYAEEKRRPHIFAASGQQSVVLQDGTTVDLSNTDQSITQAGKGKIFGASDLPANYTIVATPNKDKNTVDFKLTYTVDPRYNGKTVGSTANHTPLFGIELGEGYAPGTTIPMTAYLDPKNPKRGTSNPSLQVNATSRTPGYSYGGGFDLGGVDAENNRTLNFEFSVPVKDWNGKLDYKFRVGMFNSREGYGDTKYFESYQNYFKDDYLKQGDFNPGIHETEETVEIRQESVPFDTETRYNPDLPVGTQNTIREGTIGINRYTKKVTYYKGVKISETPEQKEIVQEKVDRIIEVGTKAPESDDSGIKIGDSRFETSSELIPYQTIVRVNPDLPAGQTKTLQYGKNGEKITTYRVLLDDKKNEIGRLQYGEARITEATNEIIEIGLGKDDSTQTIRPKLDAKYEEGSFNGRKGTWVTISDTTNPEIPIELSRFFIPDGEDGKPAKPAEMPHIKDGIWWIGEKNTGIPATGPKGDQGEAGKDGETPNIEVVPSEDPENPGYTIVITNPETGEKEEIFVRDGK
ncbi:G5 domain-containing protein, partial [Dolosicoccus paucivorans]